MNRTEELRRECVEVLDAAICEFEQGGGELDGDYIALSYIAAKRTLGLLMKLEAPVEAVWEYYTNDEGRARWKCSNCGKICRRNPHDKRRCSSCGAHTRMQA